jgi:hypothetical protein
VTYLIYENEDYTCPNSHCGTVYDWSSFHRSFFIVIQIHIFGLGPIGLPCRRMRFRPEIIRFTTLAFRRNIGPNEVIASRQQPADWS